ncbi:DUF2911 domain-containing protein [Bizionia sediminis]|uniref:DUF2911 domain-containing protein n=1 Tax=Bizionia sediminis TaxID=1737064 RepID=A0ABW5KNH9_9FLAO
MKKLTGIVAFVCIVALFFSNNLQAQTFPKLDKSPMDAATFPSDYKNANKFIKVIYSRPQLKNRTIEQLAPAGKVWRTGANEAPEITFYKDTNFGDKLIKAGTYSLFTIPGEEAWTVIINKDLNTWGAYYYNEANDVARVKAPVKMADESVEAFSISFDEKGTMHMGWGNLRLAVPTATK